MTDAHRGATGVPPRPPWEKELIGVLCPSCGLGGDVPDAVVRTICPRCGTTFDVASARVAHPSPRTARPAPRPAPPAPPRPDATPREAAPAAAPAAPPPHADRTAWVKPAALGVALFALGVLVGWALFRGGADDGARPGAPLEIRRAAAARDAAGATPASPTRRAASSTGHRAVAAPGPVSHRSTTTAGSRTSKPGATREHRRSTTSTSSPARASTTSAPASPARPAAPAVGVEGCAGLDCHMTSPSGVTGVPVPDDAVALGTEAGATGWTTHVAGVEDLTAWYVDHLTDAGWVLNGAASVMDPEVGELRDLGHSTSAVYCPSDADDPIVAVNVGWPAGDTSGGTVVVAVVSGIDETACA